MSYMGVKQHCVELEKKRLVDTWRRPKPTGRPEKLYRLTRKLDGLFPQMGNEWAMELLVTADQVFGERAAAKLLFNHFQKRTERLLNSLRGASLQARVKELGRQRLAEGYLTQVRDVEGGMELVDYHDPYGVVAEQFPLVHELDRASIEQVLGVPVQHSMEEASGLMRVTHRVTVPAA